MLLSSIRKVLDRLPADYVARTLLAGAPSPALRAALEAALSPAQRAAVDAVCNV